MNNYLNLYQEEANKLDFEKILESVRIDLTKDIGPPPPVLQIDNLGEYPITIFTKGNISVIKGLAKTRKSYAVGILTAAALSNMIIMRKFISKIANIIVYFDTEQSSFYVHRAMNRIYQMSTGDGFSKRFYSYALRPFNPSERVELIEWVFNNFKGLGLVIIDGVRDLLRDINSPEESTFISSKLLKWSEKTGAHILTVLHENPSDGKLRGHIGTELMNKAETILKVEKLDNDKSVSKISCEMVRGLHFDDIYFRIENDIPEIINRQETLNFDLQ